MDTLIKDMNFNNEYNFIKDYKQDELLRRSFNKLSEQTFGINFEEWYQKGFWNNNYICYSFLFNKEVVSNVSLSKMTIIIDGKKYNAVQIGTVMTKPEHRRKGLAMKLLNLVIADYKDKCDLFFLAADEEAVALYEKCGFKNHDELKYIVDLNDCYLVEKGYLEPIEMSLEDVTKFKAKTIPLSQTLCAIEDEHVLLFYYLMMYSNCFYLVKNPKVNLDFIVLLSMEDDVVNWLDVYSENSLTELDLKIVLSQLKIRGFSKVQFSFVPDILLDAVEISKYKNGGWMVLDHNGISFPKGAWFPRISKT